MQAVITTAAEACDGNPLMMTLVAGAVRLAGTDWNEKADTVGTWETVLRDLRGCLSPEVVDGYPAPLRAYAMSVRRLDDGPGSILSTLCMFPPARRTPVEMVRTVWEQAVKGSSAEGVGFDAALLTLKRAAIVDLHRENPDGPGAPLEHVHWLMLEH